MVTWPPASAFLAKPKVAVPTIGAIKSSARRLVASFILISPRHGHPTETSRDPILRARSPATPRTLAGAFIGRRPGATIRPNTNGTASRRVMPGLDPGIHQKKGFLIRDDGLHRNSGLPEFRIIECRKSGQPDLRCQARQ